MATRHRGIIGDDPIGFSNSQNVMRRHLTGDERTMVGLKVLPLYEAEARTRMLATLKQNTTAARST